MDGSRKLETKHSHWTLIELDLSEVMTDDELSVKVLEVLRAKIPSIVEGIDVSDYSFYLHAVDRAINNGVLYPAIALSGTFEALDKLPSIFDIEAQINKHFATHQEHILELAKTVKHIDWPTLKKEKWYPTIDQ